ncbi:hypothetical protein NKI95_12420 [Mesorhizobium sp. M0306]|uniref:hypothetical protein n=2 Tax=Mesorhizobium TaxID=68287 RepID=UPI00333C3E57
MMEINMLTKILTASILAAGLATAAMAQNAGSDNNAPGSEKSIVVQPKPNGIDPGTTSSTMGTTGAMNSNADENCPATPQGAQPDASNKPAGTVSPTVNDNNCGK